MGPNSHDFPVTTLDDSTVTPAGFDPMNDADLRAMLTGIYASPVGALVSYDAQTPHQIATTIHRPDTGYSGASSVSAALALPCPAQVKTIATVYCRRCFIAAEVVMDCGVLLLLTCLGSSGTFNYFDPDRLVTVSGALHLLWVCMGTCRRCACALPWIAHLVMSLFPLQRAD